MQSVVQVNIGLNTSQAAAREQHMQRWVARVNALVAMSACTVRLAIAAIEATERERQHGKDVR